MFDYGPTAAEATPAAVQVSPAPIGARERSLGVLSIARRRKLFILGCVATCALVAAATTKLLTPKYVATAEIYIDPGSLPGAGKDALAPGQDSNGFINYVESQRLIITSSSVLDRVVADEKLDADSEFLGESRLANLMGSAPKPSDRAGAAAAVLGARIQVKRPERTFIIDLSVFDRDPIKAARLANATAHGYIEVISALQRDASRKTEDSLTGRIEALRQRILDAEKKVEDYKGANGLEGFVSDQQLKDMNSQLTGARTNAATARSLLDEIEAARRHGGDIAAIASRIPSSSLSALRTQQGEARQKLGDLMGELGPKHPQVVAAESRVSAADAAIDAELARFARSQRIEYDRAHQLELALGREVEDLKTRASADGQSSVGLRDLEREAEAARSVYELFVTRSRETGEIQQVEPSRTEIITLATPPNRRTFPPSLTLMTAAGSLLGLALGLAGAIMRERKPNPASPEPEPTPAPTPKDRKSRPPGAFTITARSALRSARWAQSLDAIELAGLGFPTLPARADAGEFRAILAALGLDDSQIPAAKRTVVLAVSGANVTGLRTTLAINLALTAARRGLGVALIDAAEHDAQLTRAIRRATGALHLDGDSLHDTEEGVLLALPKAFDLDRGRSHPEDLLRHLGQLRDPTIDLIVCDGPDPGESDEAPLLGWADEVIAFDESGEGGAPRALAELGIAAGAVVSFVAAESGRVKRA